MNAASGGTGKRILLKMLVVMIAGSSLTVTAISFAHKRGSDEAAVMDTLTFHIDAQRTGWNSMESVLTSANVSGPDFGPLWDSPPLDAVTIGSKTYPPHLYATPLYMDAVT